MIRIKSYFAKTDQGPYLQVNEDDVEVDLLEGLFLIFDGFGGGGIGDKTVKNLKKEIRSFYTKISQDPDSTMPFFYSHKYNLEGNALINALHSAHKGLKEGNQKLDISQRGGASLIALAVSSQLLSIISVGNCASYIFRRGNLAPITLPDSLASVTQEKSSFQTTPLSAMGLFEDLHLQIRELKPQQGDLVILMTDGAYARISQDELKYIVEDNNSTIPQKVEELYGLANKRGNLDNQSSIFLQF